MSLPTFLYAAMGLSLLSRATLKCHRLARTWMETRPGTSGSEKRSQNYSLMPWRFSRYLLLFFSSHQHPDCTNHFFLLPLPCRLCQSFVVLPLIVTYLFNFLFLESSIFSRTVVHLKVFPVCSFRGGNFGLFCSCRFGNTQVSSRNAMLAN